MTWPIIIRVDESTTGVFFVISILILLLFVFLIYHNCYLLWIDVNCLGLSCNCLDSKDEVYDNDILYVMADSSDYSDTEMLIGMKNHVETVITIKSSSETDDENTNVSNPEKQEDNV